MFEIENLELYYIRDVENYQQKAAAKRSVHNSLIYMTVQFCLSGAPWRKLLGHGDYGVFGTITTNHPWWTETMNNILRVPPELRIFSAASKISGENIMLRPKQKSIEWMIDQMYMIFKVRELILDTGAGTLTTDKVCLELLEHRRFLRCGKDFKRFQDVLLSVVEVYAKPVLRLDSYIAGSERVVEATKAFRQ